MTKIPMACIAISTRGGIVRCSAGEVLPCVDVTGISGQTFVLSADSVDRRIY